MKHFLARFWFTSIIAFVLVMQLVWILHVATGLHSTLATQLMFPLLFVTGTVLHFRNPRS